MFVPDYIFYVFHIPEVTIVAYIVIRSRVFLGNDTNASPRICPISNSEISDDESYRPAVVTTLSPPTPPILPITIRVVSTPPVVVAVSAFLVTNLVSSVSAQQCSTYRAQARENRITKNSAAPRPKESVDAPTLLP